LLTVHDAAAYFHVPESDLLKLVTMVGEPVSVQGQNEHGVDLYLRVDIEEALRQDIQPCTGVATC
jgi:hypothetical protein